jgi:hypothetical protein
MKPLVWSGHSCPLAFDSDPTSSPPLGTYYVSSLVKLKGRRSPRL